MKPEQLKSRIPAFIAMAIAAVLVGVDQLTKWLVVKNIEHGLSVPGVRIGSFKLFDITHRTNDGAAFSILSGQRWLLIAVTGIFLIGAIVVLFSGRVKRKWLFASITLIIAGGIGNLIDRIRVGEVVDFIELQFVRFAVFNFADMCAVVGSILLFLIVIAEEIREYRAKKACEVEEIEETALASQGGFPAADEGGLGAEPPLQDE